MKTFPSHSKLRGEWAEWQFIARAFALGFRVAKPLGDSCRYDVLIDNPTGFHRVQVKSTTARDGATYRCLCYSSSPRNRHYSPADFDFVAAYVIPEDVWFIVPATELKKWVLRLDPSGRCKRNRLHRYREAWHLLREPSTLSLRAAAEVQSESDYVWVEPLLQTG